MNNFLNNLLEYYKQHSGRIKGAAVGLLTALGILYIGLFKSIFIAFCVILGYYIGKHMETDKNFIKKILDKILPTGRFR